MQEIDISIDISGNVRVNVRGGDERATLETLKKFLGSISDQRITESQQKHQDHIELIQRNFGKQSK